MIANYLCLFFWCIISTWTQQTDFLKRIIPEWTHTFSDENLTTIPKSLNQQHGRIYYSTFTLIQNMFSSPYHRNTFRKLGKVQTRIPKSAKFFCNTNNTRSMSRPSSVHSVRPGDIDVIGGIGDSLSVGTGSYSYIFPQLYVTHRGSSWIAGGEGTWKETLTLPNIIKVFNPKLIGYSYGDSLAEQKFSQFNVAELGALSKDLPYMTKELVKRIKMDKRVNLNEDWKLITVMMGSNTICFELCYDDYKLFAEKHKTELFDALSHIKENLPRTIVNLILSPGVENILYKTSGMPAFISLTHVYECPCLSALQYRHQLPNYINVIKQFREVEKEIVEYEEFKNQKDFTVVLQTFTENLTIPLNKRNTTDSSYLSVDWFHLSQKGYARAANALWNNMIEPVGNKSTEWSKEFERFLCPTEQFPFIRTWKNSLI